jgi:N-methylhydantoinase B
MNSPVKPSTLVDPVTLEIIRTGLQSIPDLIEADLMRTAFSPLIYEYKDYAVGLVDGTGHSIALASHGLPGFLTNVLGAAVRDGISLYGIDAIEPGDVIISNHAATMGQHLNNVIMYTPIFGAGPRPVAFMAVNVHWIDIGGRYPGSCLGTDTTELIQEGLQLRTVKLYRRGQPVDDIFRVIEYNTRQPEMLLGDVAAQYAGCVRGKELFESLMARHGEVQLFNAIQQLWAQSTDAAYAAVRKVPEGVYEASSFMDDDGIDRGRPIPIRIKVIIKDGEFIVDYSGISDQVKGPYNSGTMGGGDASARIAFKYLFSPYETVNEGSFAPVKIILPEGKLISATGNAPLGYYQTPLSTVIDTIIAAVAPALPERVAAGHFGALGVFGFSGTNPRNGRFFNLFDTAHGGWGASMHGDGAGPYKTIRHADNKDIPVETLEALYPLLVENYAWRPDSGGAGKHRGGLGIDKTIRVLAPCKFNISFERFGCPPWGLAGGLPGLPASAEIETTQGIEPARKISQRELVAGDHVYLHTGGGGGYGRPEQRDRALVEADLRAGYISAGQASNIYKLAKTDKDFASA